MSEIFRGILILTSVITCIYISRKLRKSQVDGYDMVFWLLFSGLLLIVSIFPGLADWISETIGIYSTENAVFLIIIFALLIRVFLLTIKISQMEHKIRNLVEELAISDKMNKECKEEKYPHSSK